MKRLAAAIADEGFAFARGAEMSARFGPMADWPAFAASWDDLGLDTYMADGGRYRKRRHAAFGARAGEPIHRKPHQPHYQSRDYNPLNGGIARWFDPVLPEIAAGQSMAAILATCRALFERLAPTRSDGESSRTRWGKRASISALRRLSASYSASEIAGASSWK